MPDPLQGLKKIFIAADHGGFALKEVMKKHLADRGAEIIDLGTTGESSVDYPDFAGALARKMPPQDSTTMGVLICGSGQGMAITANKFPHIRAALCWNVESARLARGHNDANVLCLGARLVDQALCLEIADVFLSTPFEGGRHLNRVQKITRI